MCCFFPFFCLKRLLTTYLALIFSSPSPCWLVIGKNPITTIPNMAINGLYTIQNGRFFWVAHCLSTSMNIFYCYRKKMQRCNLWREMDFLRRVRIPSPSGSGLNPSWCFELRTAYWSQKSYTSIFFFESLLYCIL